MGRRHRIVSYVVKGAQIALVATAAVSCSDEDAQKAATRRGLLRAENLTAQRDERIAAQRTTTADGDLLPSNNQIAGVVLPRGFSPKFTFDHEWYYDGPLPFGKLQKYFDQQLDATIERPDSSAIVFARAKTKGAADMQPVTVKIYPVPGRAEWSRIQINQPKPLPERFPTPEEVEAELAARRARLE